jgi:hypothetical protein
VGQLSSLGNSLDILVAVALIFLAVSLMAVSLPLMSMIKQSERTISALERLLGTVDRELGPTLKQVDTLLGTVLELKTSAEKRIGDMGNKVGDVTGGLTKATAEAKKQSSVFGAGLFAGVRAYLEAKPDKRATERDKDAMRLSEVGK